MKILSFTSKSLLDSVVSHLVMEQVKGNPRSVLGLATGRTMVNIYAALIIESKKAAISWSQITTFNLDEYQDLGPGDAASFYNYMQQNLFSQLDFDSNRCHLPNGKAANLKLECERYETLIKQSGGIDLQLLGLGLNGHIGFNEPNSDFNSLTRVVTLATATKLQNQFAFADGNTPNEALSMGLQTIFGAKKIFLIVVGKEKASILAESLKQRDVTFPASSLLTHPDVTIFADTEALSLLSKETLQTVISGDDFFL